MNIQTAANTHEKRHLEALLSKCRNEARPEKLFDHLQALKTYLLIYLIQQNTLSYQIKNGNIVEGEIEDQLIENCTRGVGECKEIMKNLHKLLRRYDGGGADSTEFRVKSTRLILQLEQNINNFNNMIWGRK